MRERLKNGTFYGRIMIIIGGIHLIPLIWLIFYPSEVSYAPAFIIPALIGIVPGYILSLLIPAKKADTRKWQSPLQRGSLPTLFSWVFAIFLGMLPFLLSGTLDFNLSLFESVSGWTTTGLTVCDVTTLPKILLFHRAFMQYCGGLGFIIMIGIITKGKFSMELYNAEGHPDKIMPSLMKASRAIFSMYLGWLVVGTVLYTIFGMPIFDSICHTMSALSTAGFTTQAASIGAYGSLAIDIVTIILMIVGASNFYVLILLFKGKHKVLRESEIRTLIAVIVVFTFLIAFSLFAHTNMSFGKSLHESLFGVVTTYSTSGYSTMDYYAWPPFALGMLFLLMIFGGCTGSTAGGIKLIRVYILFRSFIESFNRKMRPQRNVKNPYYHKGQTRVTIDDKTFNEVAGFTVCYFVVLAIGTLLITAISDCSFQEGFFEFTSALGTVGLSCGITGPSTATGTLYVEMVGMLLGRLEIYIVFIGIYSGFSRIRGLFSRRHA